jgi:hypothetical protein
VTCDTTSSYVIDFRCALDFGEGHPCAGVESERYWSYNGVVGVVLKPKKKFRIAAGVNPSVCCLRIRASGLLL